MLRSISQVDKFDSLNGTLFSFGFLLTLLGAYFLMKRPVQAAPGAASNPEAVPLDNDPVAARAPSGIVKVTDEVMEAKLVVAQFTALPQAP